MIMPSYNPGIYIETALDSVLSQLGDNDEVIVQDGESTDGTAFVVSKIALNDRRLRFIQEKDDGQSDALNRALKRSTKEYVLWLNADDVVLPGAIDALKSEILDQSQGVDFIYGLHQIINGDGGVISHHNPGEFKKASLLLRGCYIFSGSFLIRRHVLESIGGFAQDLHYCMDLDLLLRIVAHPNLSVGRIPVPVGALRWHTGSKSGGQAGKFVAEGWKVRKRFYGSAGELVLGSMAAVIQAIAIGTTPVRHSAAYQRIRGRGMI